MGTIVNEILEDEDGRAPPPLRLHPGTRRLAHGSPEEREFAEGMARGYLIAVQATVDEIRKRMVEGVIAAG